MQPFAPKLTSDIGYTQAPTAPAAEPSVFSGIGDALSGALKTADKAFDSFKPKAPTYQQLKDEDELNSLNAFQTGTEKAAQLRAQGFDGQATAMENQIALDYVRAGGDPTSEEAKYIVERTTGRNWTQFGLSEETHAMMKLQESPEYEAAFLATWNTLPKDATGEDRMQAASVQAMQIFSAKSVVAVATGKSEAQAAMNKLNWDAPGGGRASYELLIENFLGPQLGAAMIADQAGQPIDPVSLANSSLKFEQFKTNMLASRPRGLDEAQWSNVTAKLAGIREVYDALINKGETLKGAHASALIQSVVKNPDISAIVKHVILNTKDFTEFGLTGADYASAFTALQNTNEPLWKIGDRNPRDLISGAAGLNSGNKGKPNGTISQEALDAYKGDPKKHLESMNGISKYFRALTPKAAGMETQTVANISQKMAASVYNSTVPFAAADINDAYNTGLIGTIREVGKTDPQTAWAMARQHSEALDQMSTKSYQNANKKFGDFAKLGQDGKVRLNWANAFDNLPASGEFRAFIEDEMRAALEPYDGDLYAFTKAYRGSKQGRSDAPKFSRGVREFMNSMDMRVFMEEGGELKEQMDSLVAINAARGRMQAEADLIENAYSTAVEAGDEFTQEVAPAAAPVPRERPVVETTAPSAGGILGLGGFPDTNGVPLGERAVGKVGDALGDAARYVGSALISPAGASTLPPAKQIENMGQSSYESKLKEYVGSHESNPQRAKAAGYASEYDVPIGYGKFDDPNNPPKPLTAMTFTEVYAYQKTLIKNSKGKLKNVDPSLGSSAVGRWQIIGPTLKRLTKKLGLQDSDKFTKNVQDQMFKILLDEAGQAKFKAGVITGDQFQDNLSKIWASVPNSKGVSTYGQPVQSDRVPVPTAPVPKARPSGTEELPESQILDTVTQTVPDATPKEVKEVIDHLQGANTLDTIRALGPRQRAIMSAILNAYSEEGQQQPEQPAASSTVGSGPYRQPTPTPFVLGE
jgi:hypothetical protein